MTSAARATSRCTGTSGYSVCVDLRGSGGRFGWVARGRVHEAGMGRWSRSDRMDCGAVLVQRFRRHDWPVLGRLRRASDRGATPPLAEGHHHRGIHRRSLSRRHASVRPSGRPRRRLSLTPRRENLPPFSLHDNHALSGTALWTGRLLGFDRKGNVVAGDAEIRVAMEALRGSAAFTSLKSWSVGSAPGAIGSGAAWGDGDLRYSIAVNGNTFTQIGGDDGTLTGIFTGESHEGAAGTLMLWASTPHRQGPAIQSSKLPSSTQL